MTQIFTIAAANYLPMVRVLADSVKQHCPEATFSFAIVDEVPPSLKTELEPFDNLITLHDLDVPHLKSWLFMHDIAEACTGLKPFALKWLLENSNDDVIYFDPDIAVFSGLEPVTDRLAHSSILLTPHILRPEDTDEAIKDNELNALKHGLYNLGFVAVKNDEEGREYAAWWARRTYLYCYEDPASGIWTDQKWNDLVPLFFNDVEVLMHPGLNVATWNYAQRTLSGSLSEGITVDGLPLVFHHFSGHDRGTHAVMRDKYGSHMRPALELSSWYGEMCGLHRTGQDPSNWAFSNYDNGEAILRSHRRLYRRRKELQERFPDPFAVQTEKGSFSGWLDDTGLYETEDPESLRPFGEFIDETADELFAYVSSTSLLNSWQRRFSTRVVETLQATARRIHQWLVRKRM